jgi:transcriptional regulator with XRE-family HTH domain
VNQGGNYMGRFSFGGMMPDWLDFQKTLKKSFKDKEYRQGYVDDFLNAYVATQIKVLREQRGWSQKELAERCGMMQPRISVMEDVNYKSWSITTLRKIAEAFDLTLCISFESFEKCMEDIEKFGREYLEKDSFDDDPYFKESE